MGEGGNVARSQLSWEYSIALLGYDLARPWPWFSTLENRTGFFSFGYDSCGHSSKQQQQRQGRQTYRIPFTGEYIRKPGEHFLNISHNSLGNLFSVSLLLQVRQRGVVKAGAGARPFCALGSEMHLWLKISIITSCCQTPTWKSKAFLRGIFSASQPEPEELGVWIVYIISAFAQECKLELVITFFIVRSGSVVLQAEPRWANTEWLWLMNSKKVHLQSCGIVFQVILYQNQWDIKPYTIYSCFH